MQAILNLMRRWIGIWKPVKLFQDGRRVGGLAVASAGDRRHPGDNVLCMLEACDGLRHVLSEGRANVTHSPDAIECRLADCTNTIVKRQMLVQRYTRNLDVVFEWYHGSIN